MYFLAYPGRKIATTEHTTTKRRLWNCLEIFGMGVSNCVISVSRGTWKDEMICVSALVEKPVMSPIWRCASINPSGSTLECEIPLFIKPCGSNVFERRVNSEFGMLRATQLPEMQDDSSLYLSRKVDLHLKLEFETHFLAFSIFLYHFQHSFSIVFGYFWATCLTDPCGLNCIVQKDRDYR